MSTQTAVRSFQVGDKVEFDYPYNGVPKTYIGYIQEVRPKYPKLLHYNKYLIHSRSFADDGGIPSSCYELKKDGAIFLNETNLRRAN